MAENCTDRMNVYTLSDWRVIVRHRSTGRRITIDVNRVRDQFAAGQAAGFELMARQHAEVGDYETVVITERRTRLTTPGYMEMRAEFAMAFGGGTDSYQHTVDWWFAVAELLYHYYGADLPDDWQFRDSPVHADGDWPEDDGPYADEMLAELAGENRITEADARTFGEVLTRYARLLRLHGLGDD